MLNPRRERIQDDLRGLIDGDVFANTVETQVYATDASLYEIQPLCVVCPKTTLDVVSVVRYARKHGLSIHPRGAGSNCVGASLGEGIILDMSRYMRRLLFYQPETNLLHVQAGIQCSRLNDLLKPYGHHIHPGADESWPNTIGGLLSLDGYGSRWLSFGRPSDWLCELEMVSANGNIITLSNQEPIPENDFLEINGSGIDLMRSTIRMNLRKQLEAADPRFNVTNVMLQEFDAPLLIENLPEQEEFFEPDAFASPEDEKKWMVGETYCLLNEYRSVQESKAMRRVIDKMGYRTNILNGKNLNMARLIAGAEGTLGIITAVKLQLPEIPAVRKTFLLFFTSMEKAMQAVPLLLPFHPDACELIDRRYLHLAAEHDVRFDTLFPDQTEAVLLVELSDSSQYNALSRIRSLSEQLIRQKELAFQLLSAVDEVEADFFWKLAGTFEPSTQYGKGKPVRITIVEDAAVTPGKLHEFFLKTQELLRKHELTAAFYSHAIQGQVRLQPLADLHSNADAQRVMRFAREYYSLVHQMNGTIGTENGLGLGWKFWMPIFQRPKYPLVCSIKRVFDPETLFQPGKMGTEISGEVPAPELFWRQAIRPKEPFLLNVEEPKEEQQIEQMVPASSELPETVLSANSRESEPENETEIPQSRPESAPSDVSSEEVLESEVLESQEEDAEASGLFVMEKVREILGNSVEEFLPDSVEETSILKEKTTENEEEALEPLTSLGLAWDSEEIQCIADRCNGCGKCKGTSADLRACPVFRHDCSEFSSPRTKANLMEGILSGSLDLAELGDESFRNLFHRCIQCHSCRIECPSSVDIPFLVRRAEESWARARGLNFYETSLVRLERWVKWVHHVPCLGNFAFHSTRTRWLLEKMFGIARGRLLPHFELKSFLEKLKRDPSMLSLNPEEPAVDENPVFAESSVEIQGRAVYFLDSFANYFDTSIAEATVEIFRKNNIPILVPKSQEGSGITAVMLGRCDYVQNQVYRNAAILADYVRQGFDVIVTEPTTALAFRWEFPQTYPENEDVALVAKHCFDAGEYLYKLHVLQILKMPQREINLKVGYHAPCRLRALRIGLPSVHLMGLIPGLEVVQSPHGCCGMGGTYGMMATNYTSSLKMGRPLQLWLRDPVLQAGVSECSTCRIQMAQNTTKPILHPIQILAQAY